MRNLFYTCLIASICLGCCELFNKNCPEGCTDIEALNFDSDAIDNDGSCKYSSVTFYAQFGYFQGIPITQIDLSVDGGNIGSITSVFPTGPGNCFANGTVLYEFENGNSVSWNSIVYLATGAQIFDSGVVSPNSQECIKVNVTQ